MKSLFSALLLLLLPAGVAAAADSAPAPREFVIATSFYPLYIHALNLAGGVPGVQVRNLTQPATGCLHDYQLRPGEMAMLTRADALVVNGAGMESFLDKVVRQYPKLKVIDASRGMELLKTEEEENPHVWVSVGGAMRQVETIAAGLAAADPAHAPQYQANAKAYLAKLDALRRKMHAELDALPRRDIVTMHEAFPYFAAEFKLRILAVVEREPGSEPSSRDLAEAATLVKKAGVKALFAEPQYPAKAAETLARETGATVYTLDPAVTGPATPDAYLDIMEQNLAVLKQALK